MVTMDGSEQSEIVMACVTQYETEAAIRQIIACFKKHNPSWDKVHVVLTDKDMVERNVLKQEIPQASLGICLFHVLRSFKRELTTEKMKIYQAQRDAALELVQGLAYAHSEQVYNKLYDDLSKHFPQTVRDYYNKNWHSIKEEWVTCYRNLGLNLGNTTTNRVECLNTKIKSVCTKFATLRQFFHDFVVLLKTMREENIHRNIIDSTSIATKTQDYLPEGYARCLMSFAFRIVEKEAKHADSSATLDENVSSDTCSCSVFVSMKLPCRHILKFRRLNDLPLFETVLFAERWTKAYVKGASTIVHVSESETNVIEGDYTSTSVNVQRAALPKNTKCLSQFQKYRQAHQLAQKLSQLVSEERMDRFRRKMQVMESLCDHWAAAREVLIVEHVELLEAQGKFISIA